MKTLEIPTSNLPIYLREHIDTEKHPYCNITIGENIVISPSDKKFYS